MYLRQKLSTFSPFIILFDMQFQMQFLWLQLFKELSSKSDFTGRISGSQIDASSVWGLIINHTLNSWKSGWVINGLHLQIGQLHV